MILSEEQKSAIKSSAKQLLEIKKGTVKELNASMLHDYVKRALSFLGLVGDDDDRKSFHV